MKVLLLSGNFSVEDTDIIIKNSKTIAQFAANNFQWRLINGFKRILGSNFYILSAPFINSFPNGYSKIFYKGFKKNNNEIYVSFFNLFGIRNFSRYFSLKKQCKKFLNEKGIKYVLVYSPHVPLLKTAIFLKRMDPSIKIILLLPDLPQFVNLSAKKSFLYKIFKKIDIKTFYRLSANFDKYIFLTKYMNDVVNHNNKDYIVVEGLVDDFDSFLNIKSSNGDVIEITYSGTLNKKYGVCNLIDAFMMIKDKRYVLNICGLGDSIEYIKKCQANNDRIHFYGQLSNSDVKRIYDKSSVLVNPRQNIDDFTKYSFPSKNLEYLSMGIPVVAYKLDGIPDEYDNVFFYPDDNSTISLKNAIVRCSNLSSDELNAYRDKVKNLLAHKTVSNVTNNIIDFMESDKGDLNV